ncbi:MAG: arginase family protein [Candidatus Promineifilaceae bacterium]
MTPYFIDTPVPDLERLARPDWQVNKVIMRGGRPQERMLGLYKPLTKMVARRAGQGGRPVSVAGDCCTTIAVLGGLQRAGLNPTLLWLDAHGDFNTWQTTPSNFLGGMPLAMLVGRGEQTLMDGLGVVPLPEEQVILTDARDLNPGEREAVEGSAVHHLPHVVSLLNYDFPVRPLYIHFDTDLINPQEAPAMNYKTAGGPSVTMLRHIFHHLAATRRIVCVSLSSWNPQLDEDGRSREVCMALLDELVGGA